MEYDLASYTTVRALADSVIEETAEVEPWMINLSFCTDRDAQYLLRSVPGTTTADMVYGLLFGLAYDAHQAGTIDAWGLRDVGWQAYANDPNASPDHWGLDLDLAIETHIDGFATIVDVDTAVAETMLKLRPFSERLPAVLRSGQQRR